MFDALVDTRLSMSLGEPDETARAEISAAVAGALRSSLGDLLGEGRIGIEVIDRVAPWARDLVRGMHWRAQNRQTDARGFEMRSVIDRLAADPLDQALGDEGVATVATAWALTHDRVVDQIHGHQAHKRYAADVLGQRAPWQEDVFLGYSIHLILEWLRLDPRVNPG